MAPELHLMPLSEKKESPAGGPFGFRGNGEKRAAEHQGEATALLGTIRDNWSVERITGAVQKRGKIKWSLKRGGAWENCCEREKLLGKCCRAPPCSFEREKKHMGSSGRGIVDPIRGGTFEMELEKTGGVDLCRKLGVRGGCSVDSYNRFRQRIAVREKNRRWKNQKKVGGPISQSKKKRHKVKRKLLKKTARGSRQGRFHCWRRGRIT